MKIAKLTIKNIMGIEELEFAPESVTEITGANGTGKSSVMEAVKAALGGGHDATLLRKGAEAGEVVLVLDDGTEITKRVTESGSTLKMSHPTFGAVSKGQTRLNALLDLLATNPVQFLTAKPADRLAVLLEALPLELDREKLAEIYSGSEAISERHPLEVLGVADASLREKRRDLNRSAKERRASAGQIRAALPEEIADTDWAGKIAEAEKALRKLADRKETARKGYSNERQKITESYLQIQDKLRAETQARIDLLHSALEAGLEAAREKADEARAANDKAQTDQFAALETEERSIESSLEKYRASAELQRSSAQSRDFAAKQDAEAEAMETQSEDLTARLGRLAEMRSEMISSIPIEGLEVRDGGIFLHGVEFDRVNEAAKINLAIEVAKLRAGELGLVCVDGLERFDSAAYAEFIRQAAGSGLQFIVTRVGDGGLSISRRG